MAKRIRTILHISFDKNGSLTLYGIEKLLIISRRILSALPGESEIVRWVKMSISRGPLEVANSLWWSGWFTYKRFSTVPRHQ